MKWLREILGRDYRPSPTPDPRITNYDPVKPHAEDSSSTNSSQSSVDWPNHDTWSAELNEHLIQTEDGDRFVWVVDCGSLLLPSGRLVACDPFAGLDASNNPHIAVPPGTYPVSVTLADVSPNLDRSHIREAYATLRITPGPDSYRRSLQLLRQGEKPRKVEDDEYIGFPVDAGTACFVDDEAVANCMPWDDSTSLDDLIESDRPNCWFNMMDDPNHIREGLANLPLPLARNGENIVIIHSGWGDGIYPVVGSFDSHDNMIAVHIDFGVIP